MGKQQNGQTRDKSQQSRPESQQGGGRDKSGKQDDKGQQQQNVHGEGNYAASRQYNQATKDFVESGRVERAARDAEPRSDADAGQMAAAEAEGKRHSKGEDPALNRKASRQQVPESRTPRPGEDRE